MREHEVAALIRGLAPGIRKCVADAMAPMAARLVELEARPGEKGDAGERGAEGPRGQDGPAGPPGISADAATLPVELAEQVASAVRLLHESPPIEARFTLQSPSLPRVTRIERDDEGNFVPIYEQP